MAVEYRWSAGFTSWVYSAFRGNFGLLMIIETKMKRKLLRWISYCVCICITLAYACKQSDKDDGKETILKRQNNYIG
jgi:hypothetical protein